MQTDTNSVGRAMGALKGIPNVINTAAATVRSIVPMVGTPQTFIVQTFRRLRDDDDVPGAEKTGDTLFLECIDGDGVIRIFCPPEITKIIARQRDALTGRTRKRAARAGYETRKAKGTQVKPPRPKRRKAVKS